MLAVAAGGALDARGWPLLSRGFYFQGGNFSRCRHAPGGLAEEGQEGIPGPGRDCARGFSTGIGEGGARRLSCKRRSRGMAVRVGGVLRGR